MTEQEQKRLAHAKRQYLLRINDTPVAILVDDDETSIVSGCFECVERDGDIIDVLNGNPINIVLGRITDETVLGYAHFMLAGIIEKIKLDKKDGTR